MVLKKRTPQSYDPAQSKEATFRRKIETIRLGDVSASVTLALMNAPYRCKILDVKLLVKTAIAAHDTNYWSFLLQNSHDGGSELETDMMTAAKTTKITGGAAMAQDTPYSVTPDVGQNLSEDETLTLAITKAASASTLDELLVQVEYEHSGVATTTSTSTTTTTTTTTSTSSTTTTTTTTTTSTSSTTTVT